ncbi:NAD(P)H-dependent glycerol-3-phosphate dehydrogenase [Mesomycoplasma lagogenitalium]|uniref:Glycerol-3-phosphate dehydrogenase [NAD(P)+] n=1 Tax=Mesomycoplasma lagogenitalium TaxID=171286 RepID=A0ABY8LUI2_9BACT|nr:NAD(P)H-dependent glycerol-3-phosphate dehydrogenase [Mesomycoplasma lagogenitalium]WGI36891.1 NAD(P)-dependent glycerol-3-phosphate dehydrogenase [Mesomycoplasma lagogenitalium]
MNKITIIGSGAMGSAVAKVIYDSGYKNIVIYGIDKTELSQLKEGKNLKYFPQDTKLPHFQTTDNLKYALNNASYIVIAVPSKFVDSVCKDILKNLNSQVIIINVSKGFYPNSNLSLQEGLKQASKDNEKVMGVVSLLGPSHAEEIVKEQLTVVSLVENGMENAKKVQKLFSNDYFRNYLQEDEIGSEVGGAYKNILAIASGMLFGSGYGINTVAALLTRGLAEARRFNKQMGGKEITLMGLTGIGDLIVTALSPLSRNYSFGQEFAKKGKEALNTLLTVEGLTAIKSVLEIAQRKKIDLPIVFALNEILLGNITLKQAISEIWKRGLKAE